MQKKRVPKSGPGTSHGPRKCWEDKNMVMAMNVVKEGGLSVSAAASRFSVPRKTLDDRVKGRVKHCSKPGVSTVLSSTEEDALESYLIYMANRGFPLTRTMVKAFAWSITQKFDKAGHFNEE